MTDSQTGRQTDRQAGRETDWHSPVLRAGSARLAEGHALGLALTSLPRICSSLSCTWMSGRTVVKTFHQGQPFTPRFFLMFFWMQRMARSWICRSEREREREIARERRKTVRRPETDKGKGRGHAD